MDVTWNYSEQGHGPLIVFLPGWGLPSLVWKETAEWLAPHYQVICADWPNAEQQADWTAFTLDHVIASLKNRVDRPAVWIGWSLGGMWATALAAQYPEHTAGLVTIASLPSFIARPDWPCGMPATRLEEFFSQFEQDYRGTLERFIALQLRFSKKLISGRLYLRSYFSVNPLPSKSALTFGLDCLRHLDLRAQLTQLLCPTLMLFGERDALVNPQGADAVLAIAPHLNCCVLPAAGHLPFISHPDEFRAALGDFLRVASLSPATH